jgi:hypothetical protein
MAILYSPPVSHGHFYYDTAQLAAFTLYVGLLLVHGYRHGYAWRQWLPLVGAATLALMLGCQLVFLPPSEWLAWLRGDADIVRTLAEGPRSVVGGAAASLLAVVALRRALGFRNWAVLDALAGPLCWALVAQCVGCVLAGCCWGEVNSTGILSFSYGPGTMPYLAQQAQGLLPAGAGHSLPVVPTQLYQLLLCAGTGLGLHALRRRVANWPGGSRYLLTMGLLCLGRFVIEFWRDPTGEPLLAAPLAVADFSLLKIQGLLLLEGLALLGGGTWLVRHGCGAVGPSMPVPVAGLAPALVALGLYAITACFGSSLLTAPEVLTLQALLLLVLLAEARAQLTSLGQRLPQVAGLPLAALLATLLLGAMAQAPAPQHAPFRSDTITRHVTVSGGVLSNYHDADEDFINNPGGCSGSTRYNTYQRTRAAGGEVALNRTKANGYTTLGGGLWLGKQEVGVHQPSYFGAPFTIHPDTTLSYGLSDLHLYIEQERVSPRLGLAMAYRLGIHAGELGYYSYFADGGNSREVNKFAPEAMLRIGFPRILYVQGDAGYGAENVLGAYTSRLALGSGLGQLHGSRVLLGYAHSAHYPSPNLAFASANLGLPPGTGLSAVRLEPYFATDFARHNLFSLKLHYRIGR